MGGFFLKIGLALLGMAGAQPAFAQDVATSAQQEVVHLPTFPPPCRRVGDVPTLTIDPAIAADLAEIGLDRAGVFERMKETSIPETMGCWAMPVGDFDGQLISVGMAQWNFGTGSLQPVLAEWRDSFHSHRKAKRALKELAPVYGKLLFSKGCLSDPVTDKCRNGILAAHGPDGKLNPEMISELTALFESDRMLEVQLNHYLAVLEKVRGDLQRVFPDGPITMRKVRWAIDMRVQQGGLPPSDDIARLRRKIAAMTPAARWTRLDAIFAWYEAISQSLDQDGVSRDYAWNVGQWRCLMRSGQIDDEQYELLAITFLRSRSATGNSGRWQALTFSRRAKIVLGVGSVSGVQNGSCAGA
ncbi:hypothetical protein GRI58_05085 [Porphyrobacter algicida]|uniref:Uncharacterized protein n=1 Tax=Qipengyuania algicida TaxID=1836209 RepID=A0A845AG58_9SPHN|nr:hypothetical protein [Qipengyuania algicida]MXP28193.1 hypothetical protein [Qipengyuania algicida]